MLGRRATSEPLPYIGSVIWLGGVSAWELAVKAQWGFREEVPAINLFERELLLVHLNAADPYANRVLLTQTAGCRIFPLRESDSKEKQASRIIKVLREYYGLYRGRPIAWRRYAGRS